MRRKLIVGNWKLHGLRASLPELDRIAQSAAAAPGVDVVICPPFTLIERSLARQPRLAIGAQDCHSADTGAHTGCISAAMLREAGASVVILGHSERRMAQGETDADVKAKAKAAIAAGLMAIICVGESAAEKDGGRAEDRVEAQLLGSVPLVEGASLAIAYEPVWAIGSGLTPSAEQVGAIHCLVRDTLCRILGTDRAAIVRILYGGSLSQANVGDFLGLRNVDGGLVGGASLKADSFVPVIKTAETLARRAVGP